MRYFLFIVLFPSFSLGHVSAQSEALLTTMPERNKTYAEDIQRHREEYKADFLKEPRSPLKQEDMPYLQFYEADQAWKINAQFVQTPDAQPFEMATYSGKTKTYVPYGSLTFSKDDKEYQLVLYQSLALAKTAGYEDYLFLPFNDLTNGETTYGGGRYLDFRMKDLADLMVVDFNKAYNPYCAYSDGYNCPIPPRENHLDLKVEAGEKLFGKSH